MDDEDEVGLMNEDGYDMGEDEDDEGDVQVIEDEDGKGPDLEEIEQLKATLSIVRNPRPDMTRNVECTSKVDDERPSLVKVTSITGNGNCL